MYVTICVWRRRDLIFFCFLSQGANHRTSRTCTEWATWCVLPRGTLQYCAEFRIWAALLFPPDSMLSSLTKQSHLRFKEGELKGVFWMKGERRGGNYREKDEVMVPMTGREFKGVKQEIIPTVNSNPRAHLFPTILRLWTLDMLCTVLVAMNNIQSCLVGLPI